MVNVDRKLYLKTTCYLNNSISVGIRCGTFEGQCFEGSLLKLNVGLGGGRACGTPEYLCWLSAVSAVFAVSHLCYVLKLYQSVISQPGLSPRILTLEPPLAVNPYCKPSRFGVYGYGYYLNRPIKWLWFNPYGEHGHPAQCCPPRGVVLARLRAPEIGDGLFDVVMFLEITTGYGCISGMIYHPHLSLTVFDISCLISEQRLLIS
jgi:hypothetical protein